MRQAHEELVKEIRIVIRDYARQHSYNLVLDVSGKTLNSIEPVVFYDMSYDITESILKILNRKASDE